MTVYALLLEYDGTGFVGWQRQANGRSLQELLETAAGRLADGAPVRSIVAGRTDAGVHAEGQVAQIELPVTLPPDRLRDALNFHLKPHRLVVLQAAEASENFSARFDALGRRYRYIILDRPTRPALDAGRVWHVARKLDAALMHAAAQRILGRHDFTSFRAVACQAKSPVRTLDRLDVARIGDRIEIVAAARSFLHHQVRNLVGTLRQVGDGSHDTDHLARVLAAADRRTAGPTAPPDGLTLVEVRYPTDPFTARSLSLHDP